ncbi:MAG: lysylphosphatidylglycerol synthase transmembrane domain-containing protein [Planctomycetia bacterium]|nr:lysylphosphatidylglycerol synthase transmembrane domain-containing protein [Planctomycetia bacterium]
MKHLSPRLKKQLIFWFQLGLTVLIFVAIWGTLEKAWTQLTTSQYTIHISPFWLVFGAVSYAISLPFPATYWYFALRHLRQQPRWLRAVRAHLVGHVGKYVPGKVCVVLIRTGLLRGKNVDTTVCVLSIFLEGLLQMAVGAFLVTAVLLWWVWNRGQENLLIWAILLFLAVAVPILPPVFKRIIQFIGVRKFSEEVRHVNQLPWSTFLVGIPLMIGFWLFLGLSYWGIIRGMGLWIPFSEYPLCLAAIASSMVAGFVFVIAPAGLGVRDAFMIYLTVPIFAHYTSNPEAAALVAAVLLRLVWLTTEMVLAGIFYTLPIREET